MNKYSNSEVDKLDEFRLEHNITLIEGDIYLITHPGIERSLLVIVEKYIDTVGTKCFKFKVISDNFHYKPGDCINIHVFSTNWDFKKLN